VCILNKRGFNLIELTICVCCIGILSGITTSRYQKYVANSRKDDIEVELRLFHINCNRMIEDNGTLVYTPSNSPTTAQKSSTTEYLSELAGDYCKVSVDLSSITYSYGQVSVNTKNLPDAYGNPYKIIINTDSTSDYGGTIIFTSAGADGKFETSSYASGKFRDDELVIIIGK
jgi:Tfp pilus assembly protein PilE